MVNGRAGWREPGGPWEHTPSRAPASSRHAGPGNPPDHCPGLGEALIPAAGPPPRQSPSSLLSPQFSGMWYEIALASNLEHQSSSPQRKVGAVIVEQDGPHLSLTSVSDHMNLCMKEKNQAVKGDAPGKFKIPLQSGGKEVIVVATDYKTYAIMNIILNRGGKPSSVLKLYSRTLEHNEEATEKFVEKAVEQGLSVSNVQLLTKHLTCVNLLP
ncbi:epididymal-specific lipocalin-5 [Bubalus bubalis]|uniref:epididymal-specific lipocalin-5 n=1 Tax=Bubalus bubalis TaxID=89462 RepID=UPI001D11EF95|nr:epididymal-specific lipocalin-5 [Bubalus bubalis]